ncbi:CYTH domain-containing protein [Candidatus Pacearchaeota archaeon]|nr:CYTH domain-containing protein [Candidatus Pacearchaeota archaeon]
MIECEIRAFIPEEKYNELLDFFGKNAELVKQDAQETIYFDCKEDVRIQRNNFHSKIWMKKGLLHDDAREEIEIICKREDFENLQNIFSAIGLQIHIKWLRKRLEFFWKGCTVCIDFTKGYGYIIELEKLTTEDDREKAVDELREKLKSLNIIETSKEVFNEKYEYYKENWRMLL